MNSISEMLGVGLVLWIAWHIAQRIAPTQGVVRTWSKRLAGATFFVVLLLAWRNSPPQEFVDVLAILARAAVAGGGVLVVGWLALPILFATWQNLRPLIIRAATWPADVVRGPRRRREQAAQAVAQAAAARQAAIDRERRAHAEAIAAEQLTQIQRRRENARMECYLFYGLHSAEINERFPRSECDQFVTKYMRDDLSPSEVEQRGAQLRQIIQRHCDKVHPPPKFKSLGDLANWFQEQKTQAEQLTDQRLRRTVLAQLNERYAELSTRLMEEMQA